jgi:molybdopterin molybdotransferase
VAFGRRGAALWFGLPGNPVSASVCFHLFVRYALDCLEGAARPGVSVRRARLAQGIRVRGRRETYRDGVLEPGADGVLRVSPVDGLGSHDLAAHARADVLIRIPADAEALPAETVVDCLLLER